MSLATPKFPDPISRTSSYLSLSCMIGISIPGPTVIAERSISTPLQIPPLLFLSLWTKTTKPQQQNLNSHIESSKTQIRSLKNKTRVAADKNKTRESWYLSPCEKVSTFTNQTKWGYFILSFRVRSGWRRKLQEQRVGDRLVKVKLNLKVKPLFLFFFLYFSSPSLLFLCAFFHQSLSFWFYPKLWESEMHEATMFLIS